MGYYVNAEVEATVKVKYTAQKDDEIQIETGSDIEDALFNREECWKGFSVISSEVLDEDEDFQTVHVVYSVEHTEVVTVDLMGSYKLSCWEDEVEYQVTTLTPYQLEECLEHQDNVEILHVEGMKATLTYDDGEETAIL